MTQKLKLLNQIAEKYNYSLSHFLVPTTQRQGLQGAGRFSDENISPDILIAIIGGVIVDEPDQMICMPIGNKLYLHQVHSLFRATTNHSCEPNCRIRGFNELVRRVLTKPLSSSPKVGLSAKFLKMSPKVV